MVETLKWNLLFHLTAYQEKWINYFSPSNFNLKLSTTFITGEQLNFPLNYYRPIDDKKLLSFFSSELDVLCWKRDRKSEIYITWTHIKKSTPEKRAIIIVVNY